jgi:alanine racemase
VVRAFAEIDLEALRSNVARLRERAGSARLLAVVKADGYGHGLVPCAKAALEGGAQWLGVALLEEALALRTAGIKARTIAWLTPLGSDFDSAIREDIDLSIPTREHLKAVIASGRKVGVRPRVHLEIDTGMSRGGVFSDSYDFRTLLEDLVDAVKKDLVEVVGAWTHFARADEPEEEMNVEQIAKFDRALEEIFAAGLSIPIHHIANSAATLSDVSSERAKYSMMRSGIAIYGLSPDVSRMGDSSSLELKPVMTLKAQLQLVKEVPAGASVGYGATAIVERDTKLGVVAMGYADGIPRNASSAAGVFVKEANEGRRAPIIGRVSMDQFVVDLGKESSAETGDLVIVFGDGATGEYTADDWAKACGTINYEIVTRIGPRVPRIWRNYERTSQ